MYTSKRCVVFSLDQQPKTELSDMSFFKPQKMTYHFLSNNADSFTGPMTCHFSLQLETTCHFSRTAVAPYAPNGMLVSTTDKMTYHLVSSSSSRRVVLTRLHITRLKTDTPDTKINVSKPRNVRKSIS